MTRALENRLAKIETLRAGPPAFFVEVTHDAWDHGDKHLAQATADAIHVHQDRTGYRGAVLVGPVPCATEAEWTARYGTGF